MKKISYNIIIVILTMFLFVFAPQLRILLLINSIMFIMVEISKSGIDRPQMSLRKVLPVLLFTFVITVFVSKVLVKDIQPIGYSFLIGLVYFKLVSYNEEAVFRVMLPKHLGAVFSTILYAFIHLYLISLLTDSLQLVGVYFVTTLIFGGVMMVIYNKTRNFGIIDGIHWGFDVVKSGVF